MTSDDCNKLPVEVLLSKCLSTILLDTSRADFNYCGANLFNSLTVSIREGSNLIVTKFEMK